ncbi:uncharacterized protein PV06_11016 [Exophiala oligosperma]|uniref:Major facilitator superfamily (MFS) profile domain-containing protein n=1 Tax=Exophiala oligosperma TaxID=215243 RepID=A0A0D2BGU7_9EURO|nr:uncharacterized protein PV06_11016 [Exophiala oligosperma]KIW36717.1 hypothetical protein PV06_11016 [Exophiala oligosperma]
MQGASHNIASFILARFFVGACIAMASLPAPVLVAEIAYPTQRGKVTSLYQMLYYAGAIASSWITFGTFHMQGSTWSWRIPSVLQATFPLIQLIGLFFTPESPRWQISKGKLGEARNFLIRYHGGGEAGHPLVEFEMQEMVGRIQSEEELAGTGWSSLWMTKADKKRLAIVAFTVVIAQWSGNGIITYYLALVLDSIDVTSSFTKTLISGILQIFNFFAAMLGSLMVDRVGRRKLWLYSTIGMLVSYIVYIVLLTIMVIVVYLFYAETKGHSLEEIADIFEGPGIVAAARDAPHILLSPGNSLPRSLQRSLRLNMFSNENLVRDIKEARRKDY